MTARRYSSLVPIILLFFGCSAATSTSSPRDGTPPDMPTGMTPPTTEPTPTAPVPTDACGATPATTVRGVVRFPNGTLPVARALVYVSVDPLGAVPRSGTCGECVDRSGVYAIAETDVDGTFELTGVPSDTTMVVVQKGPFVRRVPVALTPCVSNELTPEQTRLPRDGTEGDVPRIAVVTGTYDHMQSVLARLGLSPSVYETIEGEPLDYGPPPEAANRLFRDRAALTSYDYVFVNCGAGLADAWEWETPLTEPGVRDNIRAFVQGGGRLYVTDLAHDVVEVTLPSAMDFGGSGGLSESAEPMDGAANGTAISGAIQAEVLDDDLRAWLAHNGSLDAAGKMAVRGLSDGFVVIQAASPERAKAWVAGHVSWESGGYDSSYDGPSGSGIRPLTVTADRGCGRALFTSYHTVDEGGGLGALSPQEQALAYLVLEIGNCIEEPTLF